MDVGRRLARLRDAHGDSLRQAALRTGVSHSTIARIEKGEVTGSFDLTLRKIAAGYNVPFQYMLTEQSPPRTRSAALLPRLTADERASLLFIQGRERLRRAVAMVTRGGAGHLSPDQFGAALGVDFSTIERTLNEKSPLPAGLSERLPQQLAELTGLSSLWFRWSLSEGELEADTPEDWSSYLRLAEKIGASGLLPGLLETVIELLRLGDKPQATTAALTVPPGS